MTRSAGRGHDDAKLTRYQLELLERLRPILEGLDRRRVTDDSGLRIAETGESRTVEVRVEARDGQVPGLHLLATADQCLLSFADSEVLECHRDPGGDERLVSEVVRLAARYLSGTTVVEHLNARGKVVRVEHFYGIDSEAEPGCRIGTSSFPLSWPREVERTAKRTYRFLRDRRLAGRDGWTDDGS